MTTGIPLEDPVEFYLTSAPPRDTQGTRAGMAALTRAQHFIGLVRDEGPATVGAYLDGLDPDQHYALTVTLAALVPIDETPADLLAWINDPPAAPPAAAEEPAA